MSLKFGIYLVEQRIISPEQFCGLVKIQQEAGASLATVAIRKNLLSIKQVASVLDQQELNPNKSFVQIAVEQDFLDRADAELLVAEQQSTTPTIRKLVQECGLLTDRQCNVLHQHFQRIGTRPIDSARTTEHQQNPTETTQPAQPIQSPEAVPTASPAPNLTTTEPGFVRAPKFKQRPVIVSQYSTPTNG
ncbi:MAG: hypothetical protein AAGA30_03670 [Planctomycetota bacterium]